MTKLLTDDLLPITQNFTVFDQTYCPLMRDHPYYKDLLVDPYDRYRNLHLVWASEICKNKFNETNTLLIDSDDTKVQLCLENSIVDKPYDLNAV